MLNERSGGGRGGGEEGAGEVGAGRCYVLTIGYENARERKAWDNYFCINQEESPTCYKNRMYWEIGKLLIPDSYTGVL